MPVDMRRSGARLRPDAVTLACSGARRDGWITGCVWEWGWGLVVDVSLVPR